MRRKPSALATLALAGALLAPPAGATRTSFERYNVRDRDKGPVFPPYYPRSITELAAAEVVKAEAWKRDSLQKKFDPATDSPEKYKELEKIFQATVDQAASDAKLFAAADAAADMRRYISDSCRNGTEFPFVVMDDKRRFNLFVGKREESRILYRLVGVHFSTPLDTGQTVAEQCDALGEMLQTVKDGLALKASSRKAAR